MRKAYRNIDEIWSGGYFISMIGVDEVAIRKYIERQYKEDVSLYSKPQVVVCKFD